MKSVTRSERNIKKIALVGFGIALTVAVLFSVKLTLSIIYWNDERHINQALEPWMTIGYIARSHGVDLKELAASLPFEVNRGQRKTLEQTAKEQNISPEVLQEIIEKKLSELKAQAGND